MFQLNIKLYYIIQCDSNNMRLTTTVEGRHLSENPQLKRCPVFKTNYFMRIRSAEHYLYLIYVGSITNGTTDRQDKYLESSISTWVMSHFNSGC